MILVTGANGFVGAALCPALIAAGHSVRGQIRRSEGQVDSNADSSGAVEHVVADLLDSNTDWGGLLAGCSSVIHLAGLAHESYLNDPTACYSINTLATLKLAEQAAAAGVQRLVFASTVKVHGDSHVGPCCESDSPLPQDAYGLSKWQAEQGLQQIAARTGIEVVILRFPLVYGPGVRGNFLRLMRAVDGGVPLPFGCIDNRRSLIYLGNLVSALQSCLGDRAANQTYLVADGEDISTPSLIRQIALALNKPNRLLPVPKWILRACGVVGGRQQVLRLLGSLYVDDSRIRRELDWTPPYSMREGLLDTAAWFQCRAGH